MRKISLAALLVVAGSGMAFADSGSVSLGYGQINTNNVDINTTTLSGTFEKNFANGLTVNAIGRHSGSNGAVAVEVTNAFVDLTYGFQSGTYIGGYLQRTLIMGSALNAYGFILGYKVGATELSAFYGETDISNGTTDDWGLAASYEAPNWAAHASHQVMDSDSVDPKATGIAGGYMFKSNISVFAAYASFDNFNDLSSGSIGASYAFNNTFSGVPIVASAEYMNIDTDYATSEKLSFMLTMQFGNEPGIIPDQSFAGSVANPGYSSNASFFDGIY
ncbi:porin-like protein [Octadecabacter antarcticus 307]|uniref:Porin-like protein n=1 Tax=Octadecabacter antarcticus 307 TaxID=391626 RepID=M9RA34_9RHOB|nr:hypothetical protein [Octadecabacter antarcticus]AGI67241.1 porin-like protein [Octadecabacter antarcticus 307]